ncbi:hypothetical protein HUT03_02215, partial [Candidatus Liberibacter africanus]
REKERQKRYYLNNNEEVAEYQRQYCLNNKEKQKEYLRKSCSIDYIEPLLEPLELSKKEEDALEAKIARLKAMPQEQLLYVRK